MTLICEAIQMDFLYIKRLKKNCSATIATQKKYSLQSYKNIAILSTLVNTI